VSSEFQRAYRAIVRPTQAFARRQYDDVRRGQLPLPGRNPPASWIRECGEEVTHNLYSEESKVTS